MVSMAPLSTGMIAILIFCLSIIFQDAVFMDRMASFLIVPTIIVTIFAISISLMIAGWDDWDDERRPPWSKR